MRKIKIAALLLLALTLLAATAWADGEIMVELVSEPLVCSDVEFRVTAPNADVFHVHWYNKDGEDLGISDHELQDGVGTFSSWVEEPTTETLVVSVELNGQEYSDTIVVNYEAIGELSGAPTVLTTAPVIYGLPYTVTWEAVPGAERYFVYLMQGDDWWRIHTTTETTVTFGEDAVMFLGSHDEYTIRVYAVCTGMASVICDQIVPGQGGPDSRVTLNISKPNAGSCEWINFTVNAPGAERVALVLDGEDHIEEGDTYDVDWLWYGTGEVEAYGKACYDGQWVAFTEKQHVTITSQGKVDTPEISYPAELPLDTELELFVGSAEHAAQNNGVSVIISDQDKNWLITLWDIEPGVIRCDTSLFDPGEYSIEVRIIGEPGWEANFFYGSFTVVGERPAAPTLTMNKTDYDFSDLIGVLISSENAEMFKLIYEGYDQDGNKVFDNGTGFTTEENDGTWNMAFKVNRGDTTVYVQARAKIDGLWSYPATATVHVGPSKGILTKVDYTIPQQVALGEAITLFIEDQEHFEWLNYSIYNSDDEFVARGEIDGTGAQTIMPDLKEEGEYFILLWPHADDWETPGGSRKSFTVVASVQNKCGENVTWSLGADSVLTLSGTGDMYSYANQDTPWDAAAVRILLVRSGVGQLDDAAFSGAVNLETVFCYADSTAKTWAESRGLKVFTLDENVLTLPADTRTIESEAFAGLGGSLIVEIPDSVTSIAADAFDGSNVAFRCNSGSAAASFAQAHGIPVVPD